MSTKQVAVCDVCSKTANMDETTGWMKLASFSQGHEAVVMGARPYFCLDICSTVCATLSLQNLDNLDALGAAL